MTIELTFLGTGTSSTLPAVSCLVDSHNGCRACRSTLPGVTYPGIDGSKNVRRNTSGLLRVQKPGMKEGKTILLDCGKSFYPAACEYFPKKGFKNIDAVILSHAHADAMNGLDDLRSWTLGSVIQSSIDIYLDQATFDGVERAFPYLTSSAKVTGGGDVPSLKWHIIDHNKPFELFGLTITPLPVHHGFAMVQGDFHPFWNLGFMFDQDLIWISDVSDIPTDTWTILEKALSQPKPPSTDQALSSLSKNATAAQGKCPLLIIDTLKLTPHASHFGIGQTLATMVRLQPQRTYIFGFPHRRTHECWTHACEALSQVAYSQKTAKPRWPQGNREVMSEEARVRTEIEEDFERWARASKLEASGWVEEKAPAGRQYWIRPAYDGLTVTVRDGQVLDDSN